MIRAGQRLFREILFNDGSIVQWCLCDADDNPNRRTKIHSLCGENSNWFRLKGNKKWVYGHNWDNTELDLKNITAEEFYNEVIKEV